MFSSLNIGIDVECISSNREGIGVYTKNIVDHLQAIDKTCNYFLYTHKKPIEFKGPKPFWLRLINGIRLIVWTQIMLPFILQKDRIDILFSPNFITPLIRPCKAVIVIYDITPLLFPEMAESLFDKYFKILLPLSVRSANRIIAISSNTKKDIMKRFKISSKKIKVIYPGVSEEYRPIKDQGLIESLRKKYNLGKGRLMLTVSTLSPRKNIVKLLEAFYQLIKIPRLGDLRLVIVGRKGWKYKSIFNSIEKLNLKRYVLFTGFIPKEELILFYNAANIFVYPTLYEGFGLPVLEAMACGCPVVASFSSSLPEVTKDAALLVNPLDSQEIFQALLKLLDDEKLRMELATRGLERAKLFGWEKAAISLLEYFKEIKSLDCKYEDSN